MNQMADEWEIVSCQADKAPLFFRAAQLVLGIPDMSPLSSTATWTVRQRATGLIRRVTAQSEQEAKEKIAVGLFDQD